MLNSSKLLFGVLFLGASQQAYAQCAIPHSITNGEVADASEVMDNFNAVADCADEGVKPTGTPQTGEIAVVTGPKSITSGNLTGDVTTSGSTQTTLAETGVVAGTYTSPTLTIDGKGRITSAANGGSGASGGGSSGWTEFVLTNPGAENGSTGWVMTTGGGFDVKAAYSNMTPREGSYAFEAKPEPIAQMYQVVDLATYSTAVDAGTAFVRVEVLAGDTWTDDDQPWLFVLFYDASGAQITRAYSPQQMRSVGKNIWRNIAAETHVPAGARTMRIYLRAERGTGTNNNVAFDAVRAFIQGF